MKKRIAAISIMAIVIALVVSFGTLAGWYMPVSRGRLKNSVESMATATQMYTFDHKERLPGASHWKAALRDYMREPARSPANEYTYNMRAAGKRTDAFGTPGDLVVFTSKHTTLTLERGYVYADGRFELRGPLTSIIDRIRITHRLW